MESFVDERFGHVFDDELGAPDAEGRLRPELEAMRFFPDDGIVAERMQAGRYRGRQSRIAVRPRQHRIFRRELGTPLRTRGLAPLLDREGKWHGSTARSSHRAPDRRPRESREDRARGSRRRTPAARLQLRRAPAHRPRVRSDRTANSPPAGRHMFRSPDPDTGSRPTAAALP